MKSLLLITVSLILALHVNCKVNLKHIKPVADIKAFKKILKTSKNVLVLYSKDDKSALNLLRWIEDVAKEIKGKGTILYINCGDSKDTKKLCKKYSVNPKPKALKHYKDGEFNKDYDRKDTQKSMLNFMLDPTGDAPWEEDPAAKNVVQVNSEKELVKLRRKEKGPLLVMFYAPWCGYCKKLKPDYAAAATELLGKAVLAGMDCDRPDAFNVRYQFNISGYPTLIYFENGEQKFNYGGKMDKQGLIDWLADPKPVEDSKEDDEVPWSETAPEVLHLTDDTFDIALKENPSIVVMFYAPWCGHCKAMKPEYVDAAKQMIEEEIAGKLAAVDCTKSSAVCKKFGVSGYPTIKYFDNAEFKFKLSLRKKEKIIEFMKNPEEPPAPPPEDLPWSEVSGPEILHLTDATFKDELKKKKHVLIMFYAPWCGHCKSAKPEYEKAAEHYKDNRKVWYAGVDCTVEKKVCEQFGVKGFPTFRYFLYGKKDFAYGSGRTSDAFIKFMEDPKETADEPEDKEPEWKDTPSGVVHLGDVDFDEFLKSHDSLLVMFYAPWCGHCKSMKPAYTEAADELLGSDHSIAAVDCTKNRKVAEKYEIKGYPTIMYFKQGTPTEYSSGRDKDAIISYLKGQSGEEVKKPVTGWAAESNFVDHLESSTFAEYIKNNPSVLVMFYAPWCGHCKKIKPAFADAANVFNHEKRIPGALAAVDCTENDVVCNKYSVRGYPTLMYFKNGEKAADYKGGRESEDFINFMVDPSKAPEEKPKEKDWSEENTDIVFLTESSFEDFVQKETCVFVMFYSGWCGHCKKMKPQFADTAKMVNIENQVPGCKIAAVDCVNQKDVCSKYGVKGYPTLKYFKDGKDKMKYKGARSPQAFIEFLKNPVDSGEKPQNAWSDEKSDVVHLTAANFDDFIKDKDVFVAFYAPWCGHCKTMKPAFTELATKLKNEGSPVVIAAVEATTNRELGKRELVKAYPTLKYYRNGESVTTFQEMRTLDSMYTFVVNQVEGTDRGSVPIDKENWEDLPSSVVHLNKETYQEYLQQTEHVLVTFHVRWCKHCSELRADMMQLASRLSSTGNVFGVAAVNCDDGEFCNAQGVTAFPTVKYFKKGQFVENYSASFKVDDMATFLQSKQRDEL